MLHDFATLKFIWWLLLGVLLIAFALTDGYDLGVAALLPFVARVLPDLVALVPVAVDGEHHLPGTREHFRVLERHRIVEAIGARRRPAFHHVECVALLTRSLRAVPRP